MPIETIHRLNHWFGHAFKGLSVHVPPARAQKLAMLVHQCMEAKTRTYHTAFHVLGLCEGMQPIQILAALFHDVVFYQADGGLPTCVSALLEDVVRPEPGFLRLLEIAPDDQATTLCVDIFGFGPGQRLSPRNGMNEFLSAVVAARLLQAHLSDSQLMAVVACIELTIPFRAPDAKGNSAAQRLAQRVQVRCTSLAADLLDKDQTGTVFVKATVANAVDLANRDVTGFIEAAPEYCLINSMLLVEESMMPRTVTGERSLLAYRKALLAMDIFLSQLDPAWVGQSHEDHPNAEAVMQMQMTARQNIGFVRDYLTAVLSTVAIIEALTRSTGTAWPMTLFLGSMRCAEDDPFPAPPGEPILHADLYQLLKHGLAPEGNPGLDAAPLTAGIYGFLGQVATQQVRQQAQQMFDGILTPLAFLQTLDCNMVSAIIRNMATIDTSRQEELLALELRLNAASMSTESRGIARPASPSTTLDRLAQ